MRNGTALIKPLTAKTAVVGAGGWVTRGPPPANDGTQMVGTDVYGCHVKAPGITAPWVEQLVAGVTVAANEVDMAYGDYGIWDCAISPSNSAYRYIFTTGYMFRKLGGAMYTRSPMAQVMSGVGGNEGEQRVTGRAIEVDPAKPLRCFMVLPTGTRYTDDGWETWTTISTATIPAPTAATRGVIVFDRSSAVVGGVTQGIYIFIPGSGLYRSTDGGATWATVASLPRTDYSSMKISSTGRVFLAGVAGNNGAGVIGIYTGSAWVGGITKQAKTVAISPHNAGHVYAIMGDTSMDCSTDNGVTWNMPNAVGGYPGRIATDIPWHGATNQVSMSNGDCHFDPLVNRLWLNEGIGCWYMPTPPTVIIQIYYTTGLMWTSHSTGIENMVSQTLQFSPSGHLGAAHHDRGVTIHPKGTIAKAFPSTHGIDMQWNLQHSQMIDYAPEDENFWAATAWLKGQGTGFTPDLGETWTPRTTINAFNPGGGVIAVLSKDVWIQGPTQNSLTPTVVANAATNGLRLTTDRGLTWTLLTIGENCLLPHPNYYLANKSLFKDRYVEGRAWYINPGNQDVPSQTGHAASLGLWRIDVNLTTFAVTITRVRSEFTLEAGYKMGPGFYRPHFAQISATEFIYAGGDGEFCLWRSTDSMATWARVGGTDDQGAGSQFAECWGVGVGKAKRGSAFQTLWVGGWRMNVPAHRTAADYTKHGLWESQDNGGTWMRHSQFPGGRWDYAQDLAADPTEYGRVAIAFNGSGTLLIEQDYVMRLA